METNKIHWIASRTYRAKPRDEPSAPWEGLFVAIAAPRKLSPAERTNDSEFSSYGCTVQVGAERSRRAVTGKDALEALFHGVLAIDTYLVAMSKKYDLQSESGDTFNVDLDGLLFGPIARKYLEHGKGTKP
jgi:hypothetical protein